MNANIRTSGHVFRGLAWTVLLSLLIAACGTATPLPVPEEATDAPEIVVVTEPPTSTPTEPPAAPSKPLSGLAADPQRVEFQAEDGKNLVGYYYPSKYADAPVIILMHWAGGDLCDWKDIARWMQNRLDENPAKLERCEAETRPAPWWDPTWFPAMNPDISIAVFAFDFRDYGESESGGSWDALKLDAKAAFVAAAGFEGVDATRMASMGASIGADGAPDGCLLYNQEAGSGCVGALSLSPGNYLGMNYAEVVTGLAPHPTWCLAAEQDGESAPTCNSASGDHYRLQIYPGDDHGMMLIVPGLDPLPMILIQDFMELVFGETVK